MIRRYRKFRNHISEPGIKPIGFTEWLLGRAAASLMATASEMAVQRGDYPALNAGLLSIWAGNQSGEGHEVHKIPPHELSRALREGRLEIRISPPSE